MTLELACVEILSQIQRDLLRIGLDSIERHQVILLKRERCCTDC